ncbi:MAG: AI-2E family transporter [Vicinamibacterales bacterium]
MTSQDAAGRLAPGATARTAKQTIIVVTVAGAAILLAVLVWSFPDVFLLAFGSVLVAILLRSLIDAVRARLSLSEGLALTLVLAVLVTLTALSTWLLAARVSAQTNEFLDTLPRGLEELRRWAAQFGVVQTIEWRSPSMSGWLTSSSVLHRLTDTFSTIAGVVIDAVAVLVVAIYLAASPRVYVEGSLCLIPSEQRARIRDVFRRLSSTLRWWILGRIGLMALNAVSTTVGLWLLGVPFALTLGILSGLLNFIPNVGPILAAAPAMLIALTQGPTQALYVAVLYVAYQSADGYLLTPLVTQQTVSVPPAITLLAQLLLGASVGLYGLLLASPLVAASLVIVRMLYVEDVLGEDKVDAADG